MNDIVINKKIKHPILYLGVLFIGVAIAALYFLSGQPLTIEICIDIVGAGIAITTLAYAAIHVRLIYYSQQQNLEIKRKLFSADLITQYNSPEMTKLSIISYALKKDIKDLKPEEVIEYLEGNQKKKTAIVASLNFFEKLAISIDHKLADEDLLKDYFRGIIRNNYHALKGFIELKRKENQNNRIFENFEQLTDRWG